jgi:hypothetical protein
VLLNTKPCAKVVILIVCLLATIITSCTFHKEVVCDSTDLPGNFRLNYRDKKENGWLTFSREELLTLFSDSTYVLERISPQGGFEMLPDSGSWHFEKCIVIIDNGTSKRSFCVVGKDLKEPKCKEKKLSNVLWKRE